jgi:hypothetical protein
MNANELRLGNWVEANSPMMQVKEITEHTVGLYMPGSEADPFLYDIDEINPIPLSPEILEKCGFELNRNNELSIEINDIASHLELMSGAGGFYYPSFTQTPQGDEERTVYFNRINSLHQLQNLIYALTGEELTYKQ